MTKVYVNIDCEVCGTIIGPVDHNHWIAERIGEAAFTNPTLMLTLLQTKEASPKAPFTPLEAKPLMEFIKQPDKDSYSLP